jgi:ketosteroid isomerase-like protein
MSQENVEQAYRAIDAVNRHELHALLDVMDDDVESVSRIVAIEGGLHGHDGVRRWWENWFDAFPDYQLEIQELRDLGDVILATVRAAGHGGGSDLPVQDQIFHVSRWRDRKCVWWQVVYTEAEALEVAGLSE